MGLPILRRRDALRGLGASVLLASGRADAAQTEGQSDGLRGHAERSGRLFGSAVRSPDLRGNPGATSELLREVNAIVPEYEMKWDALGRAPHAYDFTGADWLVAFAESKGLIMRGHTLVWHQALPAWLPASPDRGEAATLLEEHIATVVGRYQGRLQSWDVVNEAIDASYPGMLRDSLWLRALGPDYIPLAFRAAAKADPKAKLFYNDYDLECDTPDQERRREKTLSLLTDLRAQGVPIHGLGIQAHLQAGRWPVDTAKLARFIDAVARLGLDILITELDVSDRGLPAETEQRDTAVAAIATSVLSSFLASLNARGVFTWGLSDRHTWLNDLETHRRNDGLRQRAMPLDEKGQRKPLWASIARAFDAARPLKI